MRKLGLLAATAALTLTGCATHHTVVHHVYHRPVVHHVVVHHQVHHVVVHHVVVHHH
jgi:uncharacterized lipoprotein YmbA